MKKIAKKKSAKKKVVRVQYEPTVQTDVPSFDKPLDLSCKDWREKIMTGASLMPDGLLASLDQNRMARARKIFSYLCLPDVIDKPTFGDVGAEWLFEFVCAVFGSWNGYMRAINEFFMLVPKKNSKTTNAAGIMVTALIENQRPNAEFLLIAPTQAVANVAFGQAIGMIESEPELLKACMAKDYLKQIKYRKTGALLRVRSFDPSVLTGVKPVGVLLDEIHVIAEHNNADRVLGQLRGGMISQREAFMIMITTQSERIPAGIFRSELNKARKVRDGLLKLKTLPILYEFPEDMVKSKAWRDPKNWWMVTPNNGRSITTARLEEDYRSAESTGDEEIRRWASQHLNIQIGMALKEDSWNGATYWEKSTRELTLEQILEDCDVATLGIDGGGLDDMLALAVCGRHKDNGQWMLWIRAWLHTLAADRRKTDTQIYKDFAAEGDLEIVDNLGEDLSELGDVIGQVITSGKLGKEASVGVDQSGLGLILDELIYRGVNKDTQIVGISQGWRLTAAIKTTERGLAQGTIVHANQNLSKWAAGNAKVEPKGNAIMITKQVSGSAKIDPIMAIFNAVELMSRNPAIERQYQMMIIGDTQ